MFVSRFVIISVAKIVYRKIFQKSLTILSPFILQKERFPEKIILTKVGEFYEAFGIDAIMLVEVSVVCQ